MPFIPNTPESLLNRSDSKDPGTTCRGVTGSGRPCRRPLISSTDPSPAASPGHGPKPVSGSSGKGGRGAQLLTVSDDPSNPDAYCWQHRDQASSSAKSSPGPRMSKTPILEGRASLDTLMDRLGIVEAQQRRHKHRKSKGKDGRDGGGRHDGAPNKPPRPSASGRTSASKPVPGTDTYDGAYGKYEASPPRKEREKSSKFCFCFSLPAAQEAEEDHRPPRPRPVPLQSAPAAAPAGSGRKSSSNHQHLAPPLPGRPPLANNSSGGGGGGGRRRRSSGQSARSQTTQYLSLIPPTASPQTASLLMAELAKPISQQDEAGYIYIFWLTPESEPAEPAADAAKSLLSPPSATPRDKGVGGRRPSDVLDSFATAPGTTKSRGKSGSASAEKKTILLKIGRASNVQRRLNEWTRQCGYNLSLIRYYPYIPTNRPSTPRKVPHSHKVERLVHIELAGAGMRVSDREDGGWKCEACGKAHREWFEVEGTRGGVEMVDEVVRRWADWDEAQGGGAEGA